MGGAVKGHGSKTELEFFAAVERGEVVTQLTLARRVGVAVGLINALIKRAMHKGYVKARTAPYKRYAYYLTPKGFAEKSRLVAEYLEVSLEFFRRARREYAELFWQAEKAGLKRLVLVGASDLAEIAAMAARDCEIEIVAIVDEETNRERLYGCDVVRKLDDAKGWDAAVITDVRSPQNTYDWLRTTTATDRILAPSLLKITDVPVNIPAGEAVGT